jgi:hypothetical protein
MDYRGIARRADFNFRAEYPELVTEILQLPQGRYAIACTPAPPDFTTYLDYFNDSIMPIGGRAGVELTDKRPTDFVEVVAGIPDCEVARNFEGVTFTAEDLLNLLLAKFQHVPFFKIEPGFDAVTIVTATYSEIIGDTTYQRFLNKHDKLRVEAFLEGLKSGIAFAFREEAVSGPEALILQSTSNPVQTIYAANHQRPRASPFALRDESIWYDNLDRIFDGSFKKDDLFFFNENEYACYVDFSSFGNIDIRNHLFLFEVIYLTLPIDQNAGQWLAKHSLRKHEFISLVVKGRIKLVLTQPEYRYDMAFIQEVYEANPQAVISRRALAALLQIDLVTTADNYIFNDSQLLPQLRELCQIGQQVNGLDANYLYETLIWPIKARRRSFEPLERAGIYSTAAFGVNDFLQPHISQLVKKDLSFEFVTSASAIHLANALNATYFPFKEEDTGYSDATYAAIMGDSLNFYKSATLEGIKDFAASIATIKSGISPISPIDVIKISNIASIAELEAEFDSAASKQLMETLAALPAEKRAQKIAFYNQQVEAINSRATTKGEIIDLGINGVMDGIGLTTGIQFLGLAVSLLKMGGSRMAPRLPSVNKITTKLEEALHGTTGDSANIHYLSKISRVAKIKHPF